MNDTATATQNGSTFETALTTLQPIRDLAKNWDIDIAACLDEYLQDLELSLTQETRDHVLSSSLNFAQAALVLQNSSGIYSRKVDYLHSYVYKVQEEFSVHHQNAKDGNKKNGGRKSAGIDAEIEAFLNYDPHQDFLPLDDVLPVDMTEEGAKINLIEANDTDDMLNASTATTRLSMGNNATRRASWDSSWLDQSGVRVNVAAQRALFGTLDAGTLHLVGGACDIGADGVLRIPGGSLYDETAMRNSNDNHVGNVANDIAAADQDAFMDLNGGDDSFGDDNDDVGFAFPDQDDTPAEDQHASDKPLELGKRVTFAVPPAPAVTEKQKPTVDLWELLDRDVPDDKPPRPLRIGKTIVLPEGIDKLPSEYIPGSRKGPLVRPNRRQRQPQNGYSSRITETFQVTLGKRTLDSRSQSVSGLAFGNEFAYIAKETAKRKAEERRALRRQQMLERTGPTAADPDDVEEEGRVDADDHDGPFNFGFGGDDDGGFDDDDNDMNDNFASGDDAGMGSNTGIATVDELFRSDQYDVADGNINGETKTFEELCRAHIQAFARGAEKYAAETKLSARVDQWQAKLLPLLEDEGQRPEFDIHQYGIAVVREVEKSIARQSNKLDSGLSKRTNDHEVAFSDITRDCEQYDVCRMFLAALSLNNSGNIQFASSSTLESLKVNLLNSDIERPTETYILQDSR